MIRGTNRYLLLFATVVFLMSCGRNVVFTDSSVMEGKTWKLREIPVFKIPIKDTVNSNNIYFIHKNRIIIPLQEYISFRHDNCS